jgi:hypothetical protein
MEKLRIGINNPDPQHWLYVKGESRAQRKNEKLRIKHKFYKKEKKRILSKQSIIQKKHAKDNTQSNEELLIFSRFNSRLACFLPYPRLACFSTLSTFCSFFYLIHVQLVFPTLSLLFVSLEKASSNIVSTFN